MTDYGYVDVGKLADFANNTIGGLTANDIMRFPRADVQPVKRGRWIEDENCFHHCSECKENTIRDIDSYGCECGEFLTDYCPKCGADMRNPETIKG